MRFREFLYLEAGFSDAGSDWFYGAYLYPSDAFDWPDAINRPADFKFVQNRWEKEEKMGRPFHNLDTRSTYAAKYTSVISTDMPDSSDKPWRHSNKNSGLKIDRNTDIKLIGFSKTGKKANVLTKSNDLLDKTDELNRIFGKFEPEYYDLPSNFDEPWNDKQGTTKMKYRPPVRDSKYNNM